MTQSEVEMFKWLILPESQTILHKLRSELYQAKCEKLSLCSAISSTPKKKGGIFIPKYRFITDSEWENADILQAQFSDRNIPLPLRTGATQ